MMITLRKAVLLDADHIGERRHCIVPDIITFLAKNSQFPAVWIRPATEWATADRSGRPEGRPVQDCRRRCPRAESFEEIGEKCGAVWAPPPAIRCTNSVRLIRPLLSLSAAAIIFAMDIREMDFLWAWSKALMSSSGSMWPLRMQQWIAKPHTK